MFASPFPGKVHICICSIMHKQSYVSLFTLWPRSLMDMRLMVCGDINMHSDNKQVLLLLHAEVSLNAQRPISSILSMRFGHKRPRGCASVRVRAMTLMVVIKGFHSFGRCREECHLVSHWAQMARGSLDHVTWRRTKRGQGVPSLLFSSRRVTCHQPLMSGVAAGNGLLIRFASISSTFLHQEEQHSICVTH